MLVPVAELKGASKRYKTGDQTITALEPSDFKLYSNQLTLIIGPSGSGKTTLLSLIGCVIYPTEGEVWIAGRKVNDLSEKQLAALRLETIGFVFQSFNLIMPLTAEQNVMLPLELQGVPRKEARERVSEAMAKVGMADRARQLPKSLSGGQQQRVAIARALVARPSLMLCDEPTASLDFDSMKKVMAELRKLSTQGIGMAVVTHDTRLREYADRIVYVNEGRISETPNINLFEAHE